MDSPRPRERVQPSRLNRTCRVAPPGVCGRFPRKASDPKGEDSAWAFCATCVETDIEESPSVRTIANAWVSRAKRAIAFAAVVLLAVAHRGEHAQAVPATGRREERHHLFAQRDRARHGTSDPSRVPGRTRSESTHEARGSRSRPFKEASFAPQLNRRDRRVPSPSRLHRRSAENRAPKSPGETSPPTLQTPRKPRRQEDCPAHDGRCVSHGSGSS